MKVQVKIPREIISADEFVRHSLLENIIKSLGFNLRIEATEELTEQKIWRADPNPSIAALEDWFYLSLAIPLWNQMLDLFDSLELELPVEATEDEPLTKSFGLDIDLEKGPKLPTIRELTLMRKEKRKALLKYLADGGVYKTSQIAALDKLLDGNAPNYQKLAETMAVRATLLVFSNKKGALFSNAPNLTLKIH